WGGPGERHARRFYALLLRKDVNKKGGGGPTQKPPPPKFSPSRSGRGRAAGRVALRLGASLSDAAGTHHCRLPCWARTRHYRALNSSTAIGKIRPIFHCRQSTRRRQQYRH